MTVKARKQGNSLMITLPKYLNIEEGTTFDVRKRWGAVLSTAS